MSPSLRQYFRGCVLTLLAAITFVVWINRPRLQRVDFLTNAVSTETRPDPSSVSGYAGGLRTLILPERNADSYQWIAQAQQQHASTGWRIRHSDYDNVPFGRAVLTSSLYRWWLLTLASGDHLISGRSMPDAIERAALIANPVFQVVLLVVTAVYVARRFRTYAAVAGTVGIVGLAPFAGFFLAAAPDDHVFSLAFALWSVLPLLAASRGHGVRGGTYFLSPPVGTMRTRDFAIAGIAGALGLWVNAPAEAPILIGIAVSAVAAVVFVGRSPDSDPAERLPWRSWGIAGAVATTLAYLLQFFPEKPALRLETIHPLYALAWLGMGELLERFTSPVAHKSRFHRSVVIVSLLAAFALPIGIIFEVQHGGQWATPLVARISPILVAGSDDHLAALLSNTGATAIAALVPLLLVVPAAFLVGRKQTHEMRVATRPIVMALGPVIVALGFAVFQLRWWTVLDAALLALAVALVNWLSSSGWQRPRKICWAAACILILATGGLSLASTRASDARSALTEGEIISLVERDLAHWLAVQAGAKGATVFAPPNLTASLIFHGGLRGIGTPYWENNDGWAGSVRIAGASTPDEAQALIQRRGIAYIVMPSWDPFLDEYARLGSKQPDATLVGLLHRWLPPRWLRAIPYSLPKIPGFENQSVTIFQIVDVQENVVALSRLAEYFVETERIDLATSLMEALQHSFANDRGALAATVHVAHALRDPVALAKATNGLLSATSLATDENLPWDRRVSVAIALAEGKRMNEARDQLRRCLADIDEASLRSLTTLSLYRLLVLSKAVEVPIADPHLRELARSLLPAESRAGI